jgi:hypothetical protein
MRILIPVLFLFLLFTFNVVYAVQKGTFINKDAVLASENSATVVSLNFTLIYYLALNPFLIVFVLICVNVCICTNLSNWFFIM